MTYSLVKANVGATNLAASPFVASAGSGGSQAGNLAVVAIAQGGIANFTGILAPTANIGPFPVWQLAVSVTISGSGGGGAVSLWYVPNTPSALFTAKFGWTSSSGASGYSFCSWLEFHDDAGTNPAPLDVVGQIAKGTTPVPNATSGPTTQAHDLAVSTFFGMFLAATKDTIASGAGFTQANSSANGAKSIQQAAGDYMLDTGAVGVTPTDNVTFKGPYDAAGAAIATFKTADAAPPATLPSPLLAHRFPVRVPVGHPSRGQF